MPKHEQCALTLHEICAEMHKRGYVYGSQVKPMSFFPKISPPESLGTKCKPTRENVMYFSKIRETFDGVDGEDLDDPELTLTWAVFVTQQKYMMSDYPSRDLIFAKINTERVTTDLDTRFDTGSGAWRVSGQCINWPAVASRYDGITVAMNNKVGLFKDWEFDSLCIWDGACVTEMAHFKNAGTPWRYF